VASSEILRVKRGNSSVKAARLIEKNCLAASRYAARDKTQLRATVVNIGAGVKTGCTFQSLGSAYPRAFIHKNSLNRAATPTE